MVERAIVVQGERPDEVANRSTCASFRSKYPTMFAPLQSESFDLIRGGRSLALIAPTSSGKTLAVAAPLFEDRRKAVFVYPFRGLVLDQINQLVHYGEAFGLSQDDFAQVIGGTPERALSLAVAKDYILMTPDKLISLFVGGRTPRISALTILTNYAFVFDEIHAYNSLMVASLQYFIRSLKYWSEGSGARMPPLYFLSATFPRQILELLRNELQMERSDHVEGKSNTGDVLLMLRPGKDDAGEIARDLRNLDMTSNVVAIFNTAFKAWQVGEKLWGETLAKQRLFVGQDKMSERERVANFKAFAAHPGDGGLCGSPAIEAGIDFSAANLVIEESYADSFVQRFGRAARSGRDANVLCYSSTLYALQKEGQLRGKYTRREFLSTVTQILPIREPRALLTALAAYPYYKFWGGPEFIEAETLALCCELEKKGVEPLLAFRGFIPYTQYQTGEYINYRTLFKRYLPVKDGIVVGAPSLERYFFASRRPPVNANLKKIGYSEKLDADTTILLAKVAFEGFGTHWVVLEIKSAEYERNHPLEEDDNICLRGFPSGIEAGRVNEKGARNGIVRFYETES